MDNMAPATLMWPSQEYLAQQNDNQPFASPFEIFFNPFGIEDILVFDAPTLQRILKSESFHITIEDLGSALQGGSEYLIKHIGRNISPEARYSFYEMLNRVISPKEIQSTRKRVLDNLFWDLIYWKTPELYDELTAGEHLHPAIFESLAPYIRGRVVLDVAAGSGRATFESLRCAPELVYAVDPAPGIIGILEKKLANFPDGHRVITLQGSFEHLPLEDNSVDVTFTCSAFSSELGRGGETGLAEFRRVTRPGGKIAIIWPSPSDYTWLANHGFQYIGFPVCEDAVVHFESFESALRCAQLFYAGNQALMNYLLEQRQPEVAYSLLGFHQPNDYCWLTVEK